MTIKIAEVRKRFRTDTGEVVALEGVSIDVAEGEVVALVGPSGCGKTTLLRSVAGLERPDEGSIAVGGRVVFDPASKVNVEPEHRAIGMVFQSYALWPNMSVEQNVDYPLRCRKWPKGERRTAVQQVLDLVGCREFLTRYPAQLSGGQQQRIALARAVVAKPDVVLFDEPLSNLDARLREELRFEIRALHQRTGLTSLYVTHDRNEAWVVADRLVVMNQGRILQEGAADEILRRPRTAFVARFMADANCLAGTVVEAGREKALRCGEDTHLGCETGDPVHVGSEAALCVDPQDLEVSSAAVAASDGVNRWSATVLGIVRTPVAAECYVRLDNGAPWKVVVGQSTTLPDTGEQVTLTAPVSRCRLLSTTTSGAFQAERGDASAAAPGVGDLDHRADIPVTT